MNRDEVIRMAREAHHELVTIDYPGHRGELDEWTLALMERFAAVIRASTIEECAKVVDVYGSKAWAVYKGAGDPEEQGDSYIEGMSDGACECAAAIRALKGE